MSPPPKILVRAPQWLGDAVVSTFFLKRLHEKEPTCSLAVAAPAYLRALYERHPSVSEFISLPARGEGGVSAAAALLRQTQARTIYILPRSFRTALEAWRAGIPERIGYRGDLRRLLLTQAIPYDANRPYPHRYLKLIGEENFSLRGERPFFPKADLTKEMAAEKFGFSISQLRSPLLGMGPVSIAPSRTWPAERFAQVAERHIANTGGSVILFGSEREAPVTRSLRDTIGAGAVDTAGKLDLPHLGWFVSQCEKFICNDSGLMHVASAFGVPTVVIFGASDPTFAVPDTGRVAHLQKTEISCVPCLRNHCVRFGDMHLACLNQISMEEAAHALEKV